LRNAVVSRKENPVSQVVAELRKLVSDLTEHLAIAKRQKPRNVLKNKDLRSELVQELGIVAKEFISWVIKKPFGSIDRKSLTGRASDKDIHFAWGQTKPLAYFSRVNLLNGAIVGYGFGVIV